ncbi:unnamed protein product, partial [Didymodactylos carnosus]
MKHASGLGPTQIEREQFSLSNDYVKIPTHRARLNTLVYHLNLLHNNKVENSNDALLFASPYLYNISTYDYLISNSTIFYKRLHYISNGHPEVLIFIIISDEFRLIGLNWLLNIKYYLPSLFIRLFIGCHDKSSLELVEKFNLKYHLSIPYYLMNFNDDLPPITLSPHFINGKIVGKQNNKRHQLMMFISVIERLQLLRNGFTFIYSDTDILLFRSPLNLYPFSILTKNVPILFLSDWENITLLRYNSGFLFLRPLYLPIIELW